MSLSAGQKLGHYEIIEAVGAGGMGEVYRARDTKLGRDVAIKVLPEEFSKDPERLERFEREARLLAQLNHANIATLHGHEQFDGRECLVMELVEGETLAELIERGPIPFDEALPLFIAIAEGLEAAHAKGVIHRDLKPANIKIGPDGKPKILDFGLAKAFAGGDDAATGASQSPTLTKGTALGAIMGTASYMSPEQARGKLVDKRTDVWAYGCCLFEALAGTKPFEGDNVTDILAAVVRAEPDWSDLPGNTPASVRNVLRLCLQKKPEARLKDAGDARLLINDEDEPVNIHAPEPTLPWAKVVGFVLVAALAGGLIAWNLKEDAPRETVTLATVLPTSEDLGIPSRIALSPDGSKLAYEDRGGIFVRTLSNLGVELLPVSASGSTAFFSPDGESIAFFNGPNLMKMRLDGDTPLSLADADIGSTTLFTGTWGDNNAIVVSEGYPSPLLRVDASTGDVERATTIDAEREELAHYWPELLPGGDTVLYTAVITPSGRRDIVGKFLDSDGSHLIIENGASPQYVRSGHLAFARAGAIFAVRFDADRLEVSGEPFPVIEDVATDIYGDFEAAQFDVTESGTLAYVVERPDNRGSTLVWVERDGRATPVTEEVGTYMIPRLSPDGRHLAFARLDRESGQRDIWVLDLERGSRTRLTLGDGLSTDPVWAPDGRSLAFASNRTVRLFNIFSQSVDGTEGAVKLTDHDVGVTFPRSYLPDGSGLVFQHQRNIGILHLEPQPREELLLRTPFDEIEPSLSPDGRWLAYVSDESGRREVYVQPFPTGGSRFSASNEGGTEPGWSRDGSELFYRNGDRMMAVPVLGTSTLRLGTPSVLFEGRFEPDPFGDDARNYDVAPDGRFIMVRRQASDDGAQRQLNVVVNWSEELKRLDANR